jgi:[ribosomal protein S18]-alanine N-acetyltransferase
VDFVIRPYRAADFDRLWQIDQSCFAPGIAYSQMELSGFITRRNAITLVAEHALKDQHGEFEQSHLGKRSRNGAPEPLSPSAIAGFAIAQPYKKHGRILTLDVLPETRRSGLGSRLLLECETRLRQRGCIEVYLETAVDNEAALKLYHKVGYRVLRTLPDYYHATGLDAFLLGKELKSAC